MYVELRLKSPSAGIAEIDDIRQNSDNRVTVDDGIVRKIRWTEKYPDWKAFGLSIHEE
jgi:hypothetical protein